MHTEKQNKKKHVNLTFELKFNKVLEVVKIRVRVKFHQAKCSGSRVINSVLDFGQLETLITNISGKDQEIDKRITAVKMLSELLLLLLLQKKTGTVVTLSRKNVAGTLYSHRNVTQTRRNTAPERSHC